MTNAGPNSKPVLNVGDAMVELKMKQAPRGIDEKTMLQHTFRFCEADECFQNFRLVSKSWKDAVETIRFNREVDPEFLVSLLEQNPQGQIPVYYAKYLRAFRKLTIDTDSLYDNEEIAKKFYSFVLNSMEKLNEILFCCGNRGGSQLGIDFSVNMMKKSRETLKVVSGIEIFEPISRITFPVLNELEFSIGSHFISLNEFETHFPTALENMNHLELVNIIGCTDGSVNFEHLAQKYAKHCISANGNSNYDLLNFVEVKIMMVTGNHQLLNLLDKKYTPQVEYLHVWVDTKYHPMRDHWDRYREIFDQFTNLKAIEIKDIRSNSSVVESVQALTPEYQDIWQERISYFNARGIRLAKLGEIYRNQNLKIQLAKEAGISWCFHFW